MSHRPFTGERLHQTDELFAVDLARHRAAYRWALGRCPPALTLDVGAGSGHGVALLAAGGVSAIGLDRELPDRTSRVPKASFVRAAVGALPLRAHSAGRIVCFQVLEHLERPDDFVGGLAAALHPEGELLLTTPNRLISDGLNPYHVREYVGGELEDLLAVSFRDVRVLGVGASERVQPYYDQRLATLERIRRLDLLRLHRRLPRRLRLWLFARAAVGMRLLLRRGGAAVLDADEGDFPIGPLDQSSLDLLAICRAPRACH